MIVALYLLLSAAKLLNRPLSLFDARLVRVEERAGLDMLGHELGADSGYLVPVVEHGEGQVLLGHYNHIHYN